VDPLAKLEFTLINENKPKDDYFSRSNQYEDLLTQYLGEVPIEIEEQILNTFHYMKNTKN
jgi:hypothetical protein